MTPDKCDAHHLGHPPTRLYDPTPVMKAVAHLSIKKAALLLEIDRARYIRYRSGKRWMMYNTADRCAVILGLAPDQLWPDFGKPCCEYTRRGMSAEAAESEH